MKQVIIYITLLFIFAGCAQVRPLSGGPKDVHAATIDTSNTYPAHQQTNYKGESMVIAFNEFVKLQSPSTNITFTPTLPKDNEYMIKGKKLIVDFQSPLEDNTTYRLNIDEGIADYNEGNDSLYTFVFSTGSYLDSGCFKGNVKNAYTNKGLQKVYILMYHANNLDSIQNRRADYFTKTDEKGFFTIENIKPGQYEIIALEDQNQSRTYDLITEPVGFSTQRLIEVSGDSCAQFKFKISAPIDTLQYIKNVKQNKNGSFGFSINNFEAYSDISITNLSDSITLKRDYTVKDSVLFWPQQNIDGSVQLKVSYLDQTDTISVILKATESKKLKIENNLVQSDLPPGDSLTIRLNAPIDSIVRTKIHVFYNDTIPATLENIIVRGANLFQIIPEEKAEKYKVILDSGALITSYKITNDSTAFSYSIMKESDYSTIIITMDSNYVNQGYLELYDNDDNVIRKQWVNQAEVKFEKLFSKSYFVRFIEDRNQNLRWDPGYYKRKTQPENVYYLDQSITPKKGWEQKTIWEIQPE